MAEIKGSVIDAIYVPAWPKEFWTNPLHSVEDMKQLNAIDPDLNSYVTKTMAKWSPRAASRPSGATISSSWKGWDCRRCSRSARADTSAASSSAFRRSLIE